MATKDENDVFHYLGTGSFVAYNGVAKGMYLITAKHLISMFMEHDFNLWMCFNDSNGNFRSKELGTDNWHYHEDRGVDAAVYEFEWNDLDGIPMVYMHASALADRASFANLKVGIGNETITIGLFLPSSGGEDSGLEPIGRSGIISSVPKHRIQHFGKHGLVGSHEAILIEMRSIKGLSGSPVLCTLGDQHFKVVGEPNKGSEWNDTGGDLVMAIGIISGHFKDSQPADNGIAQILKDTDFGSINNGIAYVTPMWNIRDIIHSGDLGRRALERLPMPQENSCK